MNKSNSIQHRKQVETSSKGGPNNVIMEMDAENNEDESYYMSNSPVRKNLSNQNRNGKGGGLSSNASNFG